MAAADSRSSAGSSPGFWDAGDGEQCVTKTWITAQLGAGLGLVGSAYYVVGSHPITAIEAIKGGVNGIVSMAAIGAVFGVTTCLSAQIREIEDDPLNYFVGGCTSGILLGVRTHSYMAGTGACLSLGVIAALAKMGKMEGWRVSGPPRL